MAKYALVIDSSFIRDAQYDVNYDEAKEEICSNGWIEEEDEELVSDYENREWYVAEGDLIVEEFEAVDSAGAVEIANKHIPSYAGTKVKLDRKMFKLIKFEEVKMNGN